MYFNAPPSHPDLRGRGGSSSRFRAVCCHGLSCNFHLYMIVAGQLGLEGQSKAREHPAEATSRTNVTGNDVASTLLAQGLLHVNSDSERDIFSEMQSCRLAGHRLWQLQ